MADNIIADLQQRLQKLEDKELIIGLLHQYCDAVDNHRWHDYANCFAEDGTVQFENGAEIVGRDQIGTLMAGVGDKFQSLLHYVTNINVKIDGDEAAGSVYLWFAATVDTSKPHDYHGFGGPYAFKFTRTAEGWKIKTNKLNKKWAQNTDALGVFGG